MTNRDEYNLNQLRDRLIEDMKFMEMSVTDEDQFQDAVSSFNLTLRKYRDMLSALNHKAVYQRS